jgi:hypothetical protein
MVQNPHLLQRFEDEESRATPTDFARNLRLLQAMHLHARALGVWEQGPDTLPVKLRLARALNV